MIHTCGLFLTANCFNQAKSKRQNIIFLLRLEVTVILEDKTQARQARWSPLPYTLKLTII